MNIRAFIFRHCRDESLVDIARDSRALVFMTSRATNTLSNHLGLAASISHQEASSKSDPKITTFLQASTIITITDSCLKRYSTAFVGLYPSTSYLSKKLNRFNIVSNPYSIPTAIQETLIYPDFSTPQPASSLTHNTLSFTFHNLFGAMKRQRFECAENPGKIAASHVTISRHGVKVFPLFVIRLWKFSSPVERDLIF